MEMCNLETIYLRTTGIATFKKNIPYIIISYNTFPPPEYPALRKVKGYNHYQVN